MTLLSGLENLEKANKNFQPNLGSGQTSQSDLDFNRGKIPVLSLVVDRCYFKIMKTTRPGPRATRTSRTTTTAARSPKKKKKVSTKKIPAPSSPNMEKPSLPETTPLSSFASPLPVTFLPSTPSKKELSRLGGLRPVLKLLGSRKSSLSQTAALVLSNCTGEDREVCRALTTLEKIVVVEREEEERTAAAAAAAAATHAGLGPLTEHLTDSDTIVALHVAKTLAHCTAACPNKEATLHLSGWLRSLGGLRLLIGCISPHTEHERMTSAVLLSLGNLCCDDAVLCSEMRALGALESLLLLLRPGRPLVLRDRATSTLLNCVEGVDGVFEEERLMERELSEVGAVSALCRAIETLIDGRSVADATAAVSTSNQSNTRRVTEPMTCGLLDLLLRCCGSKNTGGGGKNTGGGSKNTGGEKNGEKSSETTSRTSSRRSKQGSECDELHDCGGTQLLMILLDDVRPSVQERACRLLAYACESHGRNARDIKRSVWSSGGDGALVQLAALVQHKKRSVAKSARRCLDALRNRPSLIARKSSTVSSSKDSNDETISSTSSSVEESSSKSKGGKTSDDEVLLPLIEQGIVPIFWKMARPEIEMLEEAEEAEILENEREEKENKKKKNNSSKNSSKSKKERRKKGEEKKRKEAARRAEKRGFAADYLLWLELAVDGGQQSGSATFRVLLRTLCMNGNEALRGNVAVALVILCFRNPSLRASFVREGALDATLSMLRQDAGRSHALEVLCTMEDVVSERVDLITLNKDASGAALTNPYAAAAAGA